MDSPGIMQATAGRGMPTSPVSSCITLDSRLQYLQHAQRIGHILARAIHRALVDLTSWSSPNGNASPPSHRFLICRGCSLFWLVASAASAGILQRPCTGWKCPLQFVCRRLMSPSNLGSATSSNSTWKPSTSLSCLRRAKQCWGLPLLSAPLLSPLLASSRKCSCGFCCCLLVDKLSKVSTEVDRHGASAPSRAVVRETLKRSTA